MVSEAPTRLLHVEDNRTEAHIFRARVGKIPGFPVEVTHAGTLAGALAALEAGDIDAAVLDLGLPDTEGMEGVRRLRERHPDLPIIVLTGTAEEEAGLPAIQEGADEYLQKDRFDGLLLARMIRYARERRKLLAELGAKHRAVEAAELRTSRLTEAIKQLEDLVLVTDVSGTILYANPALEQLTGYAVDEVEGRTPALLRSDVHTADFYADMWRTIASGETWRGRLVNRRKDGTQYTQETVIAPVRGADGAVVNFVSLGRDVSRERELEAQLRQSQKLQAVGQLTGGIAHDFNNLLSVILTLGSLARAEIDESSVFSSDLDEILRAAKRVQALVAKLLGFSRQAALQLQPLSLRQSLAEIESMIRVVIPASIRLEVRARAGRYLALADANAIEQILLNLVTNARDAMPNGGQLVIELDETDVDDDVSEVHPRSRQGRYVVLSVADTGIGISEEVRERIFDPFFTTKGQGGTGLGLAMVYGLMEQHGGFVHVYSEPGDGSVFRLYFPVAHAERRARQRKSSSAELDARPGETVLVVEDNAALRRAAARVLERAGYEVVTASDGQEGYEIFCGDPEGFDLILTDVVMPRMSGKELLAAVRADGHDVPVVLSSGYNERNADEPDEGGVWSIPKPWAVDELLSQVRRALAPEPEVRARGTS